MGVIRCVGCTIVEVDHKHLQLSHQPWPLPWTSLFLSYLFEVITEIKYLNIFTVAGPTPTLFVIFYFQYFLVKRRKKDTLLIRLLLCLIHATTR